MNVKLIIATTAVSDRTAGQSVPRPGLRPVRNHAEPRAMPPSSEPDRNSIWCVGLNGASTWFSKP
jgi:hypothetical protein